MRRISRNVAVLVPNFCLSPQHLFADVQCSFTTRSSVDGTIKVHGATFRVRREGDQQVLEAGFSNGGWYAYGRVFQVPADEFTIYLHVPGTDEELGAMVELLTIHESGRASLLMHHGSWGNLSQYQKAWTYQGECSVDP